MWQIFGSFKTEINDLEVISGQMKLLRTEVESLGEEFVGVGDGNLIEDRMAMTQDLG
jgi:hypothetical protein